ncbi:inner membrane protein [Halohasta litchfieldiae]|jgi:inner membrane protein|uniref:Inner membrane protein n=1 Tax=Halohasta litchfieldiae TaxID=1073996 RepID=A0A1H6Y8Y7_9EURY|nr:metal-dependent hydrolase [Halohasta litchfieldiae]ATW86826.1 inner membrane protein [Halohasta litchfieldiae]SEJ36354.1 inner membrane protein [Halohasta litchfieldiae]
MYRKGHLGVSMLVFAPIGYALVGVGSPILAAITGGVMIWFAMLPDVDHRLPLIEHRGPTHSLLFAALIGGIGWAIGLIAERVVALSFDLGLGDGFGLPEIGFAIGALTVIAHLIGDTLTPAGVNYLWPLSKRTFSVSLARADNRLANSGLFGLGILVTTGWVGMALGAF